MADQLVTVEGAVPINRHKRIGAANVQDRIEVTLKLRRKTQEGFPTLDEFLAGKRSFMTRQTLEQRYGASDADIEMVSKWAEGHGLTVSQVNSGTRQIHIKGTIGAMNAAFDTKISLYRHERTGTQFRCPEQDIHVPQTLKPIITGIFGLNDMPVVVRGRVRQRHSYAAAGNPKEQFPGSFYPNEVAKLYNFPPTTGAGQKVAILEFGGGIDQSVVSDYFTNSIGLSKSPTINPISVLGQQIAVDNDVTGEVYLDIEVIGAMAPAAVMDLYFAPWTGQGYLNAIEQAVHNDDYAAISISYEIDEDLKGTAANPGWSLLFKNVDEAFQEAVATGVPVFVSSGDQGSSSLRGQNEGQEVTLSGPDAHVGYPASSPYATAVGGTMLYADGGAITNEVVWNELGPLQQKKFYWGGGTGGGVSDRYPSAPSYQTGAGINLPSANPGGKSGRMVPDVAGNSGSTTGYLVSQTPNSQIPVAPVGGTSAAAPMWAALMACIREALTAGGENLAPFFFNDFVYAAGKTPAFRDIVGGRNFSFDPNQGMVPGAFTPVGNNQSAVAEGYGAGPGYDLCTGWGSPNGVELLNQLKLWLPAQPASQQASP